MAVLPASISPARKAQSGGRRSTRVTWPILRLGRVSKLTIEMRTHVGLGANIALVVGLNTLDMIRIDPKF